MPLDKSYIKDLINRYEMGKLSAAEVDAFFDMLGHDEVQELLADSFEKKKTLDFAGLLGEKKKEMLLQAIMSGKERVAEKQLVTAIDGSAASQLAPMHRVHLLKTAWFKYAAAIIILFTGIAIYFFIHTSQSQTEVAMIQPSPLPKQDVMPGSDRAILILSDGRKVELNNAASETINDGSLAIANYQGQLSYKNAEAAVMNTMTTPKGGQYKLTLSDGTNVWLNAASSITYPTAFKGKTREVSVTGEAYFEVAKNKEKPFIVKTSKEEITVLGTSFNVNAYPDEIAKTSLLEGSIKINNNILTPGQAYKEGKIAATNTMQDVAWKNGVFDFRNLPADAAIRQLARWYDLEIVYEGEPPSGTLGGEMGRSLTLSQVLKGLNGIIANFRLEGRRLYVRPL